MDFQIISDFLQTGDQPEAIKQLAEGVNRMDENQVLRLLNVIHKYFFHAMLQCVNIEFDST